MSIFNSLKAYVYVGILKTIHDTFTASLTEPWPLMYTLHSVMAPTFFSELPRGPRIRPTKLYCQALF